MKRLIASRKLKRTCDNCGKHFKKGDVYYKQREVYTLDYDKGCSAYEFLLCPKCKYKNEQHKLRFEMFKKVCTHPYEFIATEWRYIPGECVKEPNYDYCRLCGEIF